MPLVLLELDLGVAGVDAPWDAGQSGHEASGFEADSHLVAVVLPADGRAMDAGPNLDSQDHARLGDRPSFLRGVRVAEPVRQ
ncbi:hypothetical protein [Phycicoccus sp. HDW14]|uniref:hypothetical protein n=1 Tax=Phycicoccus sp. HDW14 TaxID=2714941 RepID=UPI0035301FA2